MSTVSKPFKFASQGHNERLPCYAERASSDINAAHYLETRLNARLKSLIRGYENSGIEISQAIEPNKFEPKEIFEVKACIAYLRSCCAIFAESADPALSKPSFSAWLERSATWERHDTSVYGCHLRKTIAVCPDNPKIS